jgi:hypothetical protein
MIRDGRMPTPEDAAQQLDDRLQRDRLGEPWEMLQDRLYEPARLGEPPVIRKAQVSTTRPTTAAIAAERRKR